MKNLKIQSYFQVKIKEIKKNKHMGIEIIKKKMPTIKKTKQSTSKSFTSLKK